MKRTICEISGSHSSVFEELIFLWFDDVFLGGCYPTFRYIHVPLCLYLMSWRTIWLFEHWRWRYYDPLRDEELLTERKCVISRRTWNSSSHVSERICGITDVCLSLLSRFPPPLTGLYAHPVNTSSYLTFSVAVVSLTPPRRSLVIVVKVKSHGLMNTTWHSHTARVDVHSCQQKSIGLKFSKSQTGSDVWYSCHHNSSRFTFPIFAHSCRFSVFHSLQSITQRIQGVTGGKGQTSGGCSLC